MLMVEAPMGLPASVVAGAIGAAPGGLPEPPAHPPAEPIIIKVPPRPHEEPEVDRPDEGEDDDSLRRAPWMPDMLTLIAAPQPAIEFLAAASSG